MALIEDTCFFEEVKIFAKIGISTTQGGLLNPMLIHTTIFLDHTFLSGKALPEDDRALYLCQMTLTGDTGLKLN